MSPIAIDPETVLSGNAPLAEAPHLKPTQHFEQSVDNLAENPLDRVWRGNKEGTIRLEGVPDFGEDVYAKRQWIKEHLAGAFQYWGKMGYGEGAAGHITVRDPVKPDHYWMNPFAVHFSSITVSKLCLVTPEGYVSSEGAQLPINTAGFYIHSAIHEERPEVDAIAHCHSLHGRAWSVFGKPIDMLNQDACTFYDNQAVYKSFGGIVLAQEEGENIAKALGKKNMVAILQNHGLLTMGSTVDECVYYFGCLDRQCKLQLQVEAACANGLTKNIIDDKDAAFTAATLQHPSTLYTNFKPDYELLCEERPQLFK
ncbi:hypothetical protein JCM11641_000371 [Rhodosporidiobolus odoratus]